MDGGYLKNGDGWETGGWTVARNPGLPTDRATLTGPHHPAEFADRLYALEALNPAERPNPAVEATEPYTLQWFLDIEQRRHGRHGRWIPRLLEFGKHAGETLLGLGDGLGTDWIQYARHGAGVVICSASAAQLALIRRNFELRGLPGRFLHAPPYCLPLESSSVDVVCVSGLLDELADATAAVDEIYRVLKPGGKILAVAPARYDVAFWFHVCFPWKEWFHRKQDLLETATVRFSARQLRRLFGRFTEHRIHKRHLCRADVPHIWRCWPRPMLARLMGRVLVLKAFKPLSAAIAVHAAAA